MVDCLNDELSCAVCLEICVNAVETGCCGHLLCEDCASSLRSCPYCRCEPLGAAASKSIRRMISGMPVRCQCGVTTTRGELANHELRCVFRSHKCAVAACQFSGPMEEFLAHVTTVHPSEVVSRFTKPAETHKPPALDRDCIGNHGNSRLGANGKYYCGQLLSPRCPCCNGTCGLSDGCNCLSCMRLDVTARALPKGYLVNREGRTAYRCETGMVYCGAKVMGGVLNCDGWCGPTNGPQCRACSILQQQLSVRYSPIVNSWR